MRSILSENRWLYKLGDKEYGPVSSEEIKELLKTSRVGPQTLISKQGSSEWKPLEDEPLFTHGDIDHKAPEVREKDLDQEIAIEKTHQDLDKPHPWHRFWARILDYLIFGFVLANIVGLFLPVKFMAPPVITLSVIFFWIFIEAAFISSCKKTPGKWLFNITVEKKDNKPVTYLDALSRSFSVWWLGLAAGLPVVHFITLIVACVKLSNNRITTWDKKGSFVVKHGKLSWWRIASIVLLYVFFGSIFFVINMSFVQYSSQVMSKIWF